ncbi:MAG: DUF975 family protein [Bacillota bacterium]|nr:DUF975 family protein [Bacillota bacterium]
MRIREIKRDARDTLKGRWGLAILLSILTFAIYSLIPSIIETLFSGGANVFSSQEGPPPAAQFVSWIFTVALFPVIYGYDITFLEMNRNKQVSFKHLFQGFEADKYFKIIGVYFLTMIYTLLWFLLLIIPGIIKSLAYSQAYYILKDHPELSPNAAITKSRQLMHGFKWKYFLLSLSFIGWGIVAVLTLGIGFIWLVPYITASNASFYNYLQEQKKERLE